MLDKNLKPCYSYAKMKFKAGDKVKLITKIYNDSVYNPIWNGHYKKIVGIVDTTDTYHRIDHIYVTWSNNQRNYYKIGDLELVESEQKHHPLTTIFR